MPGHIYTIVGMWNEAAIWMDAATRVEKRFMKESLTFPFNQWNYGHNLTYLCYIQEHLGMERAAIFGARQLIDAPLDPQDNTDGLRTAYGYGKQALARALLKFERWDELLKPKTIPWDETYADQVFRAYFEARAWFAKGDLEKAGKSMETHTGLKKDLDKNKNMEQIYGIEAAELKARLALCRGETITGLGLLADAAQREYDMQKTYADPPVYPESLYLSLGEAYLAAKRPVLAAQAFTNPFPLVPTALSHPPTS